MDIVKYPDPVLFQKADEVAGIPTVQGAAQEMMRLLLAHGGLGLAAPQVGLSQRFFVVNLKRMKKLCVLPPRCPRVMINPRLVGMSTDGSTSEEGCLSLPQDVRVKILRMHEVTIDCVDENGDRHVFTAKGMLARCIQHEMDHLDGISIINRGEQQGQIRREAAEKRVGAPPQTDVITVDRRGEDAQEIECELPLVSQFATKCTNCGATVESAKVWLRTIENPHKGPHRTPLMIDPVNKFCSEKCAKECSDAEKNAAPPTPDAPAPSTPILAAPAPPTMSRPPTRSIRSMLPLLALMSSVALCPPPRPPELKIRREDEP